MSLWENTQHGRSRYDWFCGKSFNLIWKITLFYLILTSYSFVGSQLQQGIKVLTFPEKSLPEFPELDLKVPCIFCEKEFPNTSGKNDAVLHHMLIEHQLVIGDVGQVCDLRRYENTSFQEGTFFATHRWVSTPYVSK